MKKSMLVLALLGAAAAGAVGLNVVQQAQASIRVPRLERAWLNRRADGWQAKGVCSGGAEAWPAERLVRLDADDIGAAAAGLEAACAELPSVTQ